MDRAFIEVDARAADGHDPVKFAGKRGVDKGLIIFARAGFVKRIELVVSDSEPFEHIAERGSQLRCSLHTVLS